MRSGRVVTQPHVCAVVSVVGPAACMRSGRVVTKPFAYWKRDMEPGGSFSFSKIKANDFKDACEEYQIISFNCARAS